MDEGDRRGVDRLTIQEAARRLGISEGAVRKRVARGTLHHDKAEDGRVYVYLDAGVDGGVDEGVGPNSSALISQLKDEVAYLRDENRRKDEIIMQQAMTMRPLTAAPPQEPSETRESPQTTEHLQQRSRWLAPVDKLPWWHYVVGAALVFLGTIFVYSVADRWFGRSPVIVLVGIAVIPGMFGFWVGFRQRNPQPTSYAALTSLAALLYLFSDLFRTFLAGDWKPNPATALFVISVVILFGGVPPWLLFVSGASIGNAWQRRRMARISRSIPASPVSHTTPSSEQQPRTDSTSWKREILGWGGAIIGALITLVGTIVLGRGGP